MRKLHPTLFLTVADIFVNLSAGWFGAAFIMPVSYESISNISLVALTVDLVFGTLCFVIAYKLRKIKSNKHD